MGRRFTGRSCLTILIAAVCLSANGTAEAAPGTLRPGLAEIAVKAEAAVLMDSTDGRILWAHHANERRAIASTTKILTALVVLEEAKPTEQVRVSPQAESIGADDHLISEVDLVAGETLTVENLLYALLLPSASDAAVALAEHVAGSVPEFVRMMNRLADEAGAVDSNFTNPHGLDHPEHYSTARDLAVLTREAFRFPIFGRIVATRTFTIPGPGGSRELINRNTLLGVLPGADGVKTGQTRVAGRSLVASAVRGDEKLIAVALSSPDPAADASSLLDAGFTRFTRRTIVEKGGRWGTETLGDGRTLDLIAASRISFLAEKDAVVRETFESDQRTLKVTLVSSAQQKEEFTVVLKARCGACAQQSRGALASTVWVILRPLALLVSEVR